MGESNAGYIIATGAVTVLSLGFLLYALKKKGIVKCPFECRKKVSRFDIVIDF